MTEEHLSKMEINRHLLPPPGAEVVGECIEEIRRLRKAMIGAINMIVHRHPNMDLQANAMDVHNHLAKALCNTVTNDAPTAPESSGAG